MDRKSDGNRRIKALRFQYRKGIAEHNFETMPFYLKTLRKFLWENRGKVAWLKGGIIEQPAYLVFYTSIKDKVIQMLSQPLADLGNFVITPAENPMEIIKKYVNQQRVVLGWLKLENYELGSEENLEPQGLPILEKVRHGFMLNKNIFIKADNAYEVIVPRKEWNRTVEKPMLILLKAVELTLDRKGRIVAVTHHEKFGLWKSLAVKQS